MDQINAWIESNFVLFVAAVVGLYLVGHNGGDLLTWLKSRLTGLFSKTETETHSATADAYADAYRTLEPILSMESRARAREDVATAIADLMLESPV